MLEINANTRAIDVKNTPFNNNGLSVQGDNVAEIIFFCIDRYFDATDLGHKDMNIVIQWKHLGTGDQGITNSFIRDIESQPGKVIFGWPIGEEITGTPGKIQFSVRFYTVSADADGKRFITYSFNTLSSTAVIQPTLAHATADSPLDDHSQLILNRIVASESDGSAGQDALAPIFMLNLDSPQDLDIDTGILPLIVQAYSEDGGTVSYQWKMEDGSEEGASLIGEVVYVLTTDDVAKENKIYYKKYIDADGVTAYSAITIDIGDSFAEPSNTYERFSTYQVEAVGNYYVVACNTLGKKKEYTKSLVCAVPPPGAPVVVPAENGIKTESIILAENTEGTYDGSISISATGDADGKSVLSYKWHQDEVEIIGATDDVYEIKGQGPKFNSTFQAIVTNTRNKATATAKSLYFRVTAPAQEPIVTYPLAESSVTLSPAHPTNVITVSVDTTENGPLSDGYTCTWYWVQDQTNYEPNPAVDTILGEADVPMQNGRAQLTVDINVHRGYVIYARIKNTVNGDSIEVNSPVYEIKYIMS